MAGRVHGFVFVGAMCMVMRNCNVECGLINSAKCVVVFVRDNTIGVRLCEHEHADPVLVPRIKFRQRMTKNDSRSPYIVRHQFPLQLCYAMTFNKSQGQTLSYVGLDARDDTFAHGQTYVGFARVGGRQHVCVLVRADRVVDGQTVVRNVVCEQMLAHLLASTDDNLE